MEMALDHLLGEIILMNLRGSRTNKSESERIV
jgi:hypothetical protein